MLFFRYLDNSRCTKEPLAILVGQQGVESVFGGAFQCLFGVVSVTILITLLPYGQFHH